MRILTTAPVLKHPDPSHRFTVEVDSSDVEVGTVFSQWFGDGAKLHPVAFFSKTLTPTERNYDMGDRELPVIKLALEVWGHWLEGATFPFVILTNHKNLEYLCMAKD